MNEYPRVISLAYRIGSDGLHEYAQDAELEGRLRDFAFRLRHRDAEFTPLIGFANEENARGALEPQLRAWELAASLVHGQGVLHFSFATAHIQREAPRPGIAAELHAVTAFFQGGVLRPTLTLQEHPRPPDGFVVDECVEILGEQFLRARARPEMLLTLAYSMTTCLDYYFEGPAGAAARLAISQNVLGEIRKLANTRGVGAHARKFDGKGQRQPLCQGEREWLLRMLELIVRRAAAAAANTPVGEQITLEKMPLWGG